MSFKKLFGGVFLPLLLLVCPQLSYAADFDGAQLSLWWGVPFAATLLSMAIIPIINPIFWHHHYGKVIAFWGASFLLPFTYFFGFEVSLVNMVHVLLGEYLPFIILLSALFVVAGGIYIQVDVRGTPWVNATFLIIGACLASFMGTTGASMLLIRPLLRANAHRHYRVHTVVFFIFIVSNIGGSLTPLGDPPLFLGFLKGVDFFWTLQHLWLQTLFLIAALLVIFVGIDFWALSQERKKGALTPQAEITANEKVGFAISGQVNFILLLCIVGLVLMSGVWRPDVAFNIFGTEVTLPGLVRDLGLVAVAICSILVTKKEVRRLNEFD
ncbi:MAG: sodium:proton antiporter, partial [Saezia sp.]